MTVTDTEVAHVVRMINVSKSFGGVQALKKVDFEVRSGEVHALVGENGAGKSTLLKILQGVHSPTDGEVWVAGEVMTEFTPASARDHGVAMIFQEMSLVPTLNVAQNVFLGREARSGRGLIDDRTTITWTAQLFDELGVDIDPRARVDNISTGHQQLTEIAKALSQNARLLILDEPTTALTSTETALLFEILRGLTARGVTLIYVSHRMDEISQIAQRVTVLRDGERVVTGNVAEMGIEGIISSMVGRGVTAFHWSDHEVQRDGSPLLEVRNLSVDPRPLDVSFTLHPGEILGFAGLMGSGRSELARALCGLQPITDGQILIRGEPQTISSAADALAAKLTLVPEDRRREGLILDHTIKHNTTLSVLSRLTSSGLIDDRRADDVTADLVKRLRIKTPSINVPVSNLSGGNQQKVVIAKSLATDPDVLLLDEPTAGVDVGSKAEIVELVRGLAAEGKAIILISSELPELLALSDQIIVLQDGHVRHDLEREQITATFPADHNPETAIVLAERYLQRAIQPAAEPTTDRQPPGNGVTDTTRGKP